MKQELDFEEMLDEIEDVPVSALLHEERKNRYGSIPDLPDEELADPDELERQVYLEEFGPVLALPCKGRRGGIRPTVDEDGRVDWGAFGTVDFDRIKPDFDVARFRTDRLREELENVCIMVGVVNRRLPDVAKYKVWKYLSKGILDEDHIVSDDMLNYVKLFRRARKLQGQIAKLSQVNLAKLQAEMERLMA